MRRQAVDRRSIPGQAVAACSIRPLGQGHSVRASLAAALLVGTAGCISEDAFKAVVAERDELSAKVETLEDDLDVAKGRIKELEKLAARAESIPTRPPPFKINAVRTQLKLSSDDIIKARLETSKGDILCDLYPNIAPETVLNFVGLAEGAKEWTEPTTGKKTLEPLYNNTIFHRVMDGFLIQGGDPTGTGNGGPGFRFGDEVWPDVLFDKSGRLAMASSGPSTNGSQFFITGVPTPHLNGKNTIFGQCTVDVVREIMKVEVDGAKPKTDVVLKKVHILRESAESSQPVGQQGPAPGPAPAAPPEAPAEGAEAAAPEAPAEAASEG